MKEPDRILQAIDLLKSPFYQNWDFWIFLILGMLSLAASIKAFLEANAAKNAAYEAGTTVKIQTITIELSEIIQKIDKLNIDIDFSTARDLLTEINRRVKRLTAPFKDHTEYKGSINIINSTLEETKVALSEVRPIDKQIPIVDNAIYYAIEPHFSNLSGHLAELMGVFEKRTINH